MLPAQTLRPLDASSGDHRRHTTTAPHPDEALKCPRCESMSTKFCYYNNYSLSQPRYFCKNCRRYWTKGGTLRNVPVGGGCRKNKRLKPKTLDAAVLDPSSSSMLGNVRSNICSPLPHVFSSSCSSGYAGTGLSFCRESKRLPGECISPMNMLPSLDTSFMGMNNYGSSSSVKRQEGLLYGVPDISFMENISSEKLADEGRACIQYQDSGIFNMPMESLNNLGCIEAPSKEHKLFQEESWRYTKGRDGQPEPYMDRQGDPNAWSSINGTGWPYFHSLLNSAVGAAFSC